MADFPDYISNLIITFTLYFSNLSPLYDGLSSSQEKRILAEKILRFFRIDYDIYDNTFEFNGVKVPIGEVWLKSWKEGKAYDITLYDFSYRELQDFQEILSKPENITYAKDMEVLLNAIGWTVEVVNDQLELTIKLHNFSSSSFTWNPWDETDENTDWKNLPNAPDKWTVDFYPDWIKGRGF